MIGKVFASLAALMCISIGLSSALATSSEFNVEVYAETPSGSGADGLTFDPATRVLYIGEDGSTVPTPIYCAQPGSIPIQATACCCPFLDPDTVLFDVDGSFSGIPNSVIVGGNGHISVACPVESCGQLCGISGNPQNLRFTSSGNIVYADVADSRVKSITRGCTVTALSPVISGGLAAPLAIDTADRIAVSSISGNIVVLSPPLYDSPNMCLSGRGTHVALAFGPGDILYAFDAGPNGNGEVLRIDIDDSCATTVLGVFNTTADATQLIFGPDRALYAAMHTEERVLRISLESPVPVTSTWSVALVVLTVLSVATLTIRGQHFKAA